MAAAFGRTDFGAERLASDTRRSIVAQSYVSFMSNGAFRRLTRNFWLKDSSRSCRIIPSYSVDSLCSFDHVPNLASSLL